MVISGIFGIKGDYISEIHPRLFNLYVQLAAHARKRGIDINGPQAQFSCVLYPYADPYGQISDPLPHHFRLSLAQKIIPAEELRDDNAYYANLMERYGTFVGVVTNNGTVIGPDGGLIAAASRVSATFNHKVKLTEFGSGGGSTALALMRENRLSEYEGSDTSPEMISFFKQNVAKELKEHNITFTNTLDSCFNVPLRKPMDIISVGVYYQAQPTLFAKRGREIAQCLGTPGVLVAQSGVMQDRFVTDLLLGRNAQAWPWYRKSCALTTYFHYLAEYLVEQEIIIIATNDQKKFQTIQKLFNADSHASVRIF